MSNDPVTLTRDRELLWLAPEKIVPNDNNPREAAAFTPDELAPLRRSMTAHGLFEAVIVTPYKDDLYKLIEGERRWTSARIEGIKEIPAIVVERMGDFEEQVVMFNVHQQRRAWKATEEMNAIERLLEARPDLSDEEMAQELGMTMSQFRDRRQVLRLGAEVRTAIAEGEMDYYAALRADQVAKQIVRDRPQWTSEQGGEEAVRTKILAKARTHGRGVVRELETIRRDISDTDAVPDELLTRWVSQPRAKITDARAEVRSLTERRAVEDVVKDVRRLSSTLRRFDVDMHAAPNLGDLRRALGVLMDTAQTLEEKIVSVTIQKAAS